MNSTLIVTAFFDIGRKESGVPGLSRSNDEYFQYFKFWAGIKNRLIVYTQPEFADEVRRIRASFGRENETIVVPVENVYDIEPEIWRGMLKVESDGVFAEMRLHYPAMSSKAAYDYVMFMKYYFVADAEKKYAGDDDNIAWIDFGFNRGGKCYTHEEDFNFLWCPAAEEGIHLYALHDPIKRNCAESLLTQEDCIMGSPVLLTKGYGAILYQHVKEALKALLMIDAIDDDQQLLLMACKKYVNHASVGGGGYYVHKSDWFMAIKENGGEHMRVREKPKPPSQIKTLIRKIRSIPRRIKNKIFPQRPKRQGRYMVVRI